MIIYNVQNNGPSNQLVIEVINDMVFVEPTTIAYISGNLTLNANNGNWLNRIQSYFIGKKFFKPSFEGSGKIYMHATLGCYHKFTLKENEELVLTTKAFIACRNSVTITPVISLSLKNFLSGMPIVKTVIKGTGSVMVLMPGPIVKHELKDDRFVAYESDIAAYSNQITVTRNFAGKGWLDIAHKMVQVYSGTGTIYFSPNPNKDSKKF